MQMGKDKMEPNKLGGKSIDIWGIDKLIADIQPIINAWDIKEKIHTLEFLSLNIKFTFMVEEGKET